jgi:hypothetical protein
VCTACRTVGRRTSANAGNAQHGTGTATAPARHRHRTGTGTGTGSARHGTQRKPVGAGGGAVRRSPQQWLKPARLSCAAAQAHGTFSTWHLPDVGNGARFKFAYISADIKDHPVAKRLQVSHGRLRPAAVERHRCTELTHSLYRTEARSRSAKHSPAQSPAGVRC